MPFFFQLALVSNNLWSLHKQSALLSKELVIQKTFSVLYQFSILFALHIYTVIFGLFSTTFFICLENLISTAAVEYTTLVIRYSTTLGAARLSWKRSCWKMHDGVRLVLVDDSDFASSERIPSYKKKKVNVKFLRGVLDVWC